MKLTTQVFQVHNTIWCLRQPSYLTCSYGVDTPDGVVLIDAGMNSTGQDVRDLLAAMGRSEKDLKAILLTHWHNDHTAGAQVSQQRSGCGVYYHRAEQPWLTRQTAPKGLRNWLAKQIPEWGLGILLIGLIGEAVPRAVAASEYIQHEQLIAGFEVIETPGHTPGHLSFYYPPERALFAGDALAVINGKLRFMARPVTPDLETARHSMKRCLSREIEILCPGHREPLTRGTQKACLEMQRHLDNDGPWPLFG